jgi:nuclear RNA export factor
MMQRAAVAPPRGPRGASPSVRGAGRGGIQKRRGGGLARVDKDGDLVMDAAATIDKGRSGRGHIEGGATSKPLGTGRTNSGPSRGGGQGIHRAQQAILRGLESQQANVLESRITTGVTTLRVDGLSTSKAASNPDGGLESLLGFLERKASGLDAKSNRPVKIKKVCLMI